MTKEVMHPKAAAMEQLSFSASAGQTALAHLCGPLDENLRQMETILGVKIVRRGEQFRVSGEKHAAHRALRALEVLLDRVARTGAELTPNDIQWHFVGGDDEHRAKTAYADEVSAGEVLLKTRRHDLRGRTPNQRAYLQAILSHDISFGIGPAGTGKTYLAVAAAVDAFDPYLRPLYDALFDLMGFDKVQRLMERQSIEVAPLAYMRGRTLNNAFVILDEAQNTTGEQMKMFLTRIGFGSKAVITGDITQIDLPRGVLSGLKEAARVLQGVRGISFTHFRSSDVVRHPLVARIVEAYDAAAVRDEIERRAEREHRKAEGTRSAEKDLHHA